MGRRSSLMLYIVLTVFFNLQGHIETSGFSVLKRTIGFQPPLSAIAAWITATSRANKEHPEKNQHSHSISINDNRFKPMVCSCADTDELLFHSDGRFCGVNPPRTFVYEDSSKNLNGNIKLRGGHSYENDPACMENENQNGVDISPSGDGGVRKIFVAPGHESVALSIGDEVSAYLIGKVKDVDSRAETTFLNYSTTPFTFRFGKNQIVRGLEIGIASMKLGEKSVFHVQPEYGYGDDLPWRAVSQNDTLIFEVELLCCGERDLTEGKGGVLFKTLHDDHGCDQPEQLDEVLVSLVGRRARDGHEFVRTEGPVWVELGAGLLPRGLVLGIQHMTIGMRARVILTGSWAFRSAASFLPG
jgi:FKBP-type peptidyl-prolyl cis-trans isomerase